MTYGSDSEMEDEMEEKRLLGGSCKGIRTEIRQWRRRGRLLGFEINRICDRLIWGWTG